MVKFDNAYFGSVIIDGKKYEYDVVVSWDGEILERAKAHTFSKAELLDILQKEPEVIVVGTGQSGLVKIDKDAEIEAKIQGVELVAKTTQQAIEEFNKLVKIKKKAVAVIHVTC